MAYETTIALREQDIENIELEIIALQRVMQRLQNCRTNIEVEIVEFQRLQVENDVWEKERDKLDPDKLLDTKVTLPHIIPRSIGFPMGENREDHNE